MGKQCAVKGCSAETRPSHLMCRLHWLQVPKHIRLAVWHSWKRHQRAQSRQSLNEWLYHARQAEWAVKLQEGVFTAAQVAELEGKLRVSLGLGTGRLLDHEYLVKGR